MFLTYYNTRANQKQQTLKQLSFEEILMGKTTTEELNEITLTKPINFQINEYITSKYLKPNNEVKRIFKQNTKEILQLTSEIQTFIIGSHITEETKHKFYHEYQIPKNNGKMRDIVDPNPALKTLQRKILDFMVNTLKILPHNAAHAFRQHRDAITNAEVHKQSKYIVKMDFKNFFNSITIKQLQKQLSNISIFALNHEFTNMLLQSIIFIATYKGNLPQGSPLSPYLSNLVMLEFDYTMNKLMINKELRYYWYTRYADDLIFSSKVYHDHNFLIKTVTDTLQNIYGNEIKINPEKTKILKTTGRCYITGAKLNKDNQITIGHEKKKAIKHELFNLFIAKEHDTITRDQVQSVLGELAFMHRIEPNYTDYLINKLLKKFQSPERTIYKHFKPYL